MYLTREQIDYDKNGGLYISIEGVRGNPQSADPAECILLEFYEGKVQLHIWNNNEQDAQTIVLS